MKSVWEFSVQSYAKEVEGESITFFKVTEGDMVNVLTDMSPEQVGEFVTAMLVQEALPEFWETHRLNV